ncbi:cytohesin-interacting protein [Phascolarctos cinereus]|uniref:Cytohesin-interacting protein n=1 Tax=Phascolarctos cinereus TaxID=38626 RepID=A0A6P5LWI1_PHACI|nr:cytohesin-interacting protein [Phascolarctos cinereus]
MSFQRPIQQNNNLVDYSPGPAYSLYSTHTGSPQVDNKRIQMLAETVATLPRGRKQNALTRSSSLGDFSWPQRRLVTVEKQDNGTFGFEIQTYQLQNQNACLTEMYTYISKVQEESPAYRSGLQTGDVLANVNGVNMEGFTHKQVVELIKSAGNRLRLETVNGTMILRRAELEAKLQVLKQTLREKWVEFRALQLQEQRLLHGDAVDSSGLESLQSEESLAESSPGLAATYQNRNHRLSSESSCKSWLSSMTVESEDGYQTCMSEDSCQEALSRQTSTEDECFSLKDGDLALRKSSTRRNRNTSTASSGSMSPLWEGGGTNFVSVFGTLPRKSRRGSVRKQLLKFIPGLHRAVEEEESRF